MEEGLELLKQGHSEREVESRTGIPRCNLRSPVNSEVVSRRLGRK